MVCVCVCAGWCHRVLLEVRQLRGVSSLLPLGSCTWNSHHAFACWAISDLKFYYFFVSDRESGKKASLCSLHRAKIYI